MFYIVLSLAIGSIPDTEHHLCQYFTQYRSTCGLVQDRSSNPRVFSVAASGFGMAVWAIQAEKGEIPRQKALEMINQTFDSVVGRNPAKNRGWLYHFVDKNGLPAINSEVSAVDTAIFFWGARQTWQRLGDKQLEEKVEFAISKIDRKWMIVNSRSKKYFCHGLRWENNKAVFIPFEWDDNSEGVLVYRLFNIPFKPKYQNDNLPLFAYYYPMCFLPQEEFLPALKRAIARQKKIFGHSGVTATDTEAGYQSYPKDYVSPLSLYAVSSFDQNAKEELVNCKLSPEVHSQNLKDQWKSADRIGIDEGAAVLLRHPLKRL